MNRRRWLPYVPLALILVLAGGLRAYHLNAKSFWYDEFASMELACGRGYAQYDLPVNQLIPQPLNIIDIHNARPIHEIWWAEKNGHMPPLYSVVLRLWGDVFGLGPISGRTFALVMSLLAIVAMFVVMRDLSGPNIALWCALIMAIAGPQIEFGQEARAYTMLLFEGLLAAAALVRIERRDPNWWSQVILVLTLLSLTLTHYFAIGTIFALAIYAGIRLCGKVLRDVSVCFVLAAVGWGILGAPLAIRHTHNLDEMRSVQFLQDDSPGHTGRTLMRAALLPVRYFTEPSTDSLPLAAVGAVAFALAIALPLLARRRELLLWGLWLWMTVLPILALDLARKTQHLEFIRYTLLASPALYALVACATANSKSNWLRSLPPALIVLACLAALPRAYEVWWKADWRSLAAEIDRRARPGDVTVFWRGNAYDAYAPAAYLHTAYYRAGRYGPIVILHDPPDAALLDQLHRAPGVLVVTFTAEGLSDVLDHADMQRLGYEAGAGGVWRATWK